jgi:hypothetical protein
MEGFVLIRPRAKQFVRKFDDVGFFTALYLYNDTNGLKKVDDLRTLQLEEYIVDEQIRFLTIPMVTYEKEDDYLNGLRFTDNDVAEVVEKLESELDWISILVKPTEFSEYLYERDIYDLDDIVGNFGYEDFCRLGHSKDCKTRVFIKTYHLYEGKRNELYLPFNRTERENFWWHYHAARKIYVRSVWIENYTFSLPLFALVFNFEGIQLNINSRKIIPDISRNSIDKSSKELLDLSIAKAIHQAVLDHVEMEEDEKTTLKSFIENFFGAVTMFDKADETHNQ